jgi:hypothetical protein
MADLTIRIYVRNAAGVFEDTERDFDLSEFGGFLPSIGDKILDPAVLVGRDRRDAANRSIWTIVGRYFNPRDLTEYVALIVEERTPTAEEATLVP